LLGIGENEDCGSTNFGSYNNIVNMRMYDNNGQSLSSTESKGKSEPKAEEYSLNGKSSLEKREVLDI
jgi:hypothetical protein